jgi:hypothetical protein
MGKYFKSFSQFKPVNESNSLNESVNSKGKIGKFLHDLKTKGLGAAFANIKKAHNQCPKFDKANYSSGKVIQGKTGFSIEVKDYSKPIHGEANKVNKLEIDKIQNFAPNKKDITATEEGKKAFNETIVAKIKEYLEQIKSDGTDIKLMVHGNASNVPTSYPDIDDEGKSVRKDDYKNASKEDKAKLDIEANKKLAEDRANDIIEKLKAEFPKIEFSVESAVTGPEWNYETKADDLAPYREHQFVSIKAIEDKTISSTDDSVKLESYIVMFSPHAKINIDGKDIEVPNCVISKKTYDQFKPLAKKYNNEKEWTETIKKLMDGKKYNAIINGKSRYHYILTQEEAVVFDSKVGFDQLIALAEIGILAPADSQKVFAIFQGKADQKAVEKLADPKL